MPSHRLAGETLGLCVSVSSAKARAVYAKVLRSLERRGGFPIVFSVNLSKKKKRGAAALTRRPSAEYILQNIFCNIYTA